MAETELEQTAKTAPQEEKKEAPKKVSTLESVVNETYDAGKKLGRGAVAVSLPVLADSVMGGFGASATAAAFIGAERKHPVKLSTLATAFAAFANYTFTPISALPLLPKAIATAAWNLAATGYYLVAKKLIYRESFKGYWNEFKGIAKKVLKFLYLPTLATTYLPLLAQVPSIALLSFIFKKYIDPIKEPKKEKDKTPYYVATSNVINKSYKTITSSVYDLGYLVRNFFKTQPKQPAAPAVQPA